MVPVGNSGLKEQRLGGTADSATVISFHPNAYFPFLKIKSVFSQAPDYICLFPEGPQAQGCLGSLVMVLACYQHPLIRAQMV